MISIIVCSIDFRLFGIFEKNVKDSIGEIPYEIIRIDNLKENLSITKAYNKGGSKAKFRNLLFVHEDIIFHSINWGQILVNELMPNEIGCLGVAGSRYVQTVPVPWWSVENKYKKQNYIQNRKGKKLKYDTITKGDDREVYILDGVFLATKKNVFNEIRFNENLDGFHGYDLDYSIKVAEKYKNIITKIVIEHFSMGNLTRAWFLSLIRVKKNVQIPVDQRLDQSQETKSYYLFRKLLIKYDFSKLQMFNYLIKYFCVKNQNFKTTVKKTKILFGILKLVKLGNNEK